MLAAQPRHLVKDLVDGSQTTEDRKVLTTYYTTFTLSKDNEITMGDIKFGIPKSTSNGKPIIFTIEGNAPEKGTIVWMSVEIYGEPTVVHFLRYIVYPVFNTPEKALDCLLKNSSLKDVIIDRYIKGNMVYDEEQVKKDLLAGKVYDRTYAIVPLTLP